MHLLTVAGFLGSGKTTLLLKLADAAVRKGLSTAILVNEIGEVGIDDQLMRQLDLNVYRLLNGCICCSLAVDLPITLQKLAQDYAPNLILLEPSGAADLQKVVSALKYYRGEPLQSQRSVVLLDALRLGILIKALTPLITSHVTHADVILVNKADTAGAEEVASSCAIVRELAPAKPVFVLSAKKDLPSELLEELLP